MLGFRISIQKGGEYSRLCLPESGVESTSESSESMIFIKPSRHFAAGWLSSGDEHLLFSCRIGASPIYDSRLENWRYVYETQIKCMGVLENR